MNSVKNMEDATIMIKIQSMIEMDVVLNICCRYGKYITPSCRIKEAATAMINVLLGNIPLALQLKTLNIWYITKTVNATLIALILLAPLVSS